MRTSILGCVAALLLLSSWQPSFAEDDDALIKRVGGVLEPRGKLATLTRALGQAPDERRDLGFGCGWCRFELHGEELSLVVDAVTRRDWIAGLRVTSRGGGPAHFREIRRAWGDRVEIRADGIQVRTEKAGEMKRLRRAAWKGIAPPPRSGAAQSQRAAVATLTDPLEELTFGRICYEDGSPPAGRELAGALWQTGSRDALYTVLVGANPEGRLYAAEALLRFDVDEEMPARVRCERIAKVLALGLPLRCCAGCEIFERKAAALVSPAMLRKTVVCRVLVRAKFGPGSYTERRLTIYEGGARMAQRLPAPGVLACIPRIDRAVLSEEMLRSLEKAVEAGKGFEVRDGLTTCVIEPGALSQAPKAIRDLLVSLPEGLR